MVVQTTPPPNYGNSTEDFEKWIRMATDNKINTQNSWDAALIDYFHDLSLLRDGDGINFQKASATLDGCVKIYSSRVDSAVTETGRLINGLSTSKIRYDLETNTSDSEDDEEDETDPSSRPVRKTKPNKSASQKDTLVEFKAIRVRKMDLELYIDPIFKNALSDFDEGGSKSLLLNMLKINEEQKVVFDTSATTTEVSDKKINHNEENEEDPDVSIVEQSFAGMEIDEDDEDEEIDQNDYHIQDLGEKYFKNSDFNSLTLCPSLKDLDAVLNQKATSSEVLKGLENIPLHDFVNSQDYDEAYMDVSLGDIGGGDYFDDVPQESDPNGSKYPGNRTSIFFDDMEDGPDDYGNTIRSIFGEDKIFNNTNNNQDLSEDQNILNIPDDDLLAYFDENQRRNWTGPDNWKIQKLKKTYNVNGINEIPKDKEQRSQSATQLHQKKQKEHFIIDFLSDDSLDEDIFFSISDSITLPKKEWVSQTKNVLPNDMHFTTRNFINLFTKERLINSTFNKVKSMDDRIDETFYADNLTKQVIPELNNANFFNDDANNYGGIDDYDDYEPHNPSPSQITQGTQVSLKSLNSSQSPLNYSRVAKRVDIKLLKDNLWDTLNDEKSTRKSLSNADDSENMDLKFSEVVSDLSSKYDPETKKDLSTSFFFICLLHLANENGFTITNNNDNTDLILQNFQT